VTVYIVIRLAIKTHLNLLKTATTILSNEVDSHEPSHTRKSPSFAKSAILGYGKVARRNYTNN
jgi:hypothetical protein